MANMWMVHANENDLITIFKQFGCVAIGLEVPDLSEKTSEDIKLIYLIN